MRQRTFLAAALLVLTACGGDGFLASTRFVTSLRAARARWASSGIESYELTVRHLCFCGFVEPVRVKVVDGTIVSRTVVSTGEPVPAVYSSYYPDVPGLFAIVEEAANDADELDAAFDPSYGYPAEISIDWIENAVDDEEAYLAETLTITP
jgi:hypothetical protein